eukprot:4681290-Amphidinium_carterae.1
MSFSRCRIRFLSMRLTHVSGARDDGPELIVRKAFRAIASLSNLLSTEAANRARWGLGDQTQFGAVMLPFANGLYLLCLFSTWHSTCSTLRFVQPFTNLNGASFRACMATSSPRTETKSLKDIRPDPSRSKKLNSSSTR